MEVAHQSLFKFFIKVFSLDIDVGEHEETVFIEIHVDGECVERTVVSAVC
jgi:hypothetical protein